MQPPGISITRDYHRARSPSIGGHPETGWISLPGDDSRGERVVSPLSARSSKQSYISLKSTQEEDEEETPRTHETPSSMYTPYTADSDMEFLHNARRLATTIKSYEPREDAFRCRANKDFHTGRASWLSITILVLAVYSTIFSFFWLLIACFRPRYGQMITNGSRLPPATASILCNGFAKTIELSFVTIFVALIGQALSRRAISTTGRGITLAEISMRSWVMQPGTIISHPETVRYASLSALGLLSLTAALMAMLYTTASDALVTPKLKFGRLEHKVLWGQVATEYANPQWIQSNCNTPISTSQDPNYSATTCTAIELPGQAYHNYAQWLAKWTDFVRARNGSSDQNERPRPVAILYDNTTIQGSWIEIQDMKENSKSFGRSVNNVTMAMPHSGLFAAARDNRNGIIQPQELDVRTPYS